MGKVTCDISISVDGFVAGPRQSLDNPLGEGAEDRLHRWMFEEAEAARLSAAGATVARRVDEADGFWIVMQDVEGNEFCVI